jgi:large subunit ribosomal protein L13
MKTPSVKPAEVQRAWYLIDATEKVVGRVAARAAVLLRGKHKPYFTPHVDCGDHVVVINAGKAKFTGSKEEKKLYTRYSGYMGGQKVETARQLRARKPEALIERAVSGMIPHNRLGRRIMKKLHVYPGPEHPHVAQQPVPLEL